MIVPGYRVRILIAAKPVDFRKGLDGLTALVKSELQSDPYTGTVFIFRSRRADQLKLLYWDGSGLVLTYKRLEAQRFVWCNPTWNSTKSEEGEGEMIYSWMTTAIRD